MMSLAQCTMLDKLHESRRTAIYRARCTERGTPLILKILNREYPSPSDIARFKREYEITRHLTGIEGVVRVYNLEKYKNSLAMIQEKAPGESLAHILSSRKLSVEEFLRLALRITHILGAIHQHNVIHKDINPSNILWNQEHDRTTLIDFGIATFAASSQERADVLSPTVLEGTLAYISPEQTGRMNRPIDLRTDLYSLGVTLYEMLLGFLPFQSTDKMELVHSHLAKHPPPPHDVNQSIPKAVSDIVMKLMSKIAEDRYQSARGLEADLRKCLEQLEFTGDIQYVAVGQDDVTEQFQLPQRLYGRDQDIDALLAAFERIQRGRSELMLVAGGCGTGKSALVHEINKEVVARRGYFISGEFEQANTNVPYSAIIQALQILLRHILTESEARIAVWKEKLLSTLGPSAHVMLEVIPELEHIIGKHPEMPSLLPVDAQYRLYLVLQIFLEAFHAPEHPLVLFLDNLQWADRASVNLLHCLVSKPDSQALLVIGAYREEDITAGHPFRQMLDELRETDALVHRIVLSELSPSDLTALFSDALRVSSDEVESLSRQVFTKTLGNPLSGVEFVKSMTEQKMLWFDPDNRQWKWDIEQIQSMSMTDNVVDFMVAKIQQLPAQIRRILQYAACIGNRFDLSTLSAVSHHSEADVVTGLETAIHEGLILPADETCQSMAYFNTDELKNFAPHVMYDFVHERFRAAALALLNGVTIAKMHLKIGKYLLHRHVKQHLQGQEVIEIVTHLNQGIHFIKNAGGKAKLARLNLLAGRQAKAATESAAALEYFQIGMSLLDKTSWTTYYSLTFALHKERAEAEYGSGNFEYAGELLATLLEHARTAIEKADAYNVLIALYSLQTRYKDAIQTARIALKGLGVDLPEKELGKQFQQEWIDIEAALEDHAIPALIEFPDMDAPEKQVAMQLLDAIIATTFQANRSLYQIVIARMVSLSIMYGHTPESAFAYAHYGALLGSVNGEYAKGYEFGLLAVKLSEKFKNPIQKCKTTFSLAANLTPWVKHLRYTHKLEQEAYHTALDAGAREFAGFSLMLRVMNLFYSGANLEHALEDIPKLLDFSRNTHNLAATDVITGCQRIMMNLCKLTPEQHSFETEHSSEEDYLNACQAHHSAIAYCVYQIMKGQVLYLYGNLPEALRCLLNAENAIDFVYSFLVRAEHHFYFSLTLIALFPTVSPEQQSRFLQKIRAKQQQMRIWAASCPENFQSMSLLVEAELARLTGEPFNAMTCYKQAIEFAQASEYSQHKALAHELAAEFYLEQGFQEFAELHLKEAFYDYTIWGAVRKTEALLDTYPDILASVAESRSQELRPTTGRSTSMTVTSAKGLNALDLTTVMKASQAISEKIVLPELLERMMHIVIENAGAQRGWLILKHKDAWLIEAEGSVDRQEVKVLQSIPLRPSGAMNASPLPASVIQYVIRTTEAVVLSHAAEEGNFTHDPYFAAHRTKSVLCMPLMKRGKLNGVVYLENNLTTGAFTPDRLEMLNLISAQMITSIENASLYKKLNEALKQQIELSNNQKALTHAYSRFVPGEFLSLLQKESILDVQIGDQIEKEVTIMFSDIRGFTALSEQMSPQENFNFINSYLNQISPIIRQNRGFIDKYIGDAIMALFPTNADDAVRCSINMLKQLKDYNQGRKRAGYRTIQIGIGLNTGLLMLGTVGNEDRMDGTVISDAVNLSARIEQMTKIYGVPLLISETTYFQLANLGEYSIRIIDQVQAKGKSEPITVFEVFDGDSPESIQAKLDTLPRFKHGFKLYHRVKFAGARRLFSEVLTISAEDKKQQIAQAKHIFQDILQINPQDSIARLYVERCEQIEQFGSLKEWQNVWAWVDSLKHARNIV